MTPPEQILARIAELRELEDVVGKTPAGVMRLGYGFQFYWDVRESGILSALESAVKALESVAAATVFRDFVGDEGLATIHKYDAQAALETISKLLSQKSP